MKIEGYKVESRRHKSSVYWTVLKEGEQVAQLSISPRANRNGFGSTLSSYVSVEVKGPVYFKTMNELLPSLIPSHEIHLQAMMAAEKAGHYKMWTKGGTGGNVKDRLAQGRDMAKTCAWPLLLEMLKAGK